MSFRQSHPSPPDKPRQATTNGHHSLPGVVDVLDDDELLRRELEELANQNRALLGEKGPPEPRRHTNGTPAATSSSPGPTQLELENQALRARVEELEQLLEAASGQAEQMWAEQQREYEVLLEEKSEVIRSLYLKIQELKEATTGSSEAGGHSEPSRGTHEDLRAARAELERERRQLEEDEEAIHEQMKQMELAMSRERVELARQRTEIQRMYQEYQRELEMAQRDGNLRERLVALQRRHQNPENSPPTTPPPPGPLPPRGRQAPPTMTSLPHPTQQADISKPGNGLLGKLFGKK